MIRLDLGDGLSVSIEDGGEKPFQYTISLHGEHVISYQTSADVRKPAGRVGVRNMVCRHVTDRSKANVEEQIQKEASKQASAIDTISK